MKRPPRAIGLCCVSRFKVGEQFALLRRIDALHIEGACLRDRLPLLPQQTQTRLITCRTSGLHFGRPDNQPLDIVGDTQPSAGDDTSPSRCWVKIGGELGIGQYAGSERLRLRDPSFHARGLQIRIVKHGDGRDRIHVKRLHDLPRKPLGQGDLFRQGNRLIGHATREQKRRDTARNGDIGGTS